MQKEEEIKLLQEELDQLSRQVRSQYERLLQLQQRISQLSNSNMPASPGAAKAYGSKKFSLENFIGLRLIHFIGIIVLIIGLSIGVKYAIDRDLISETMRIALAYGAGIVLYILSVRLKEKYILFSAILLSGGMASLYFITNAAHVYYNMFPFSLAFVIMALFTFYTVYEAIRYNRQEIALLGLIGAYAIPFLISKNADRADLFFLYIALINVGVIFLAIKNVWKNIGRTAQTVTWIIFIGWCSTPGRERFFGVALAFMTFFSCCFSSLFFRLSFTKNKS